MQTTNYKVDDEGFAPFLRDITVEVFYSVDSITELFYLFKDKQHDTGAIEELLKSGRHLHRHWLNGLPFVLIYSSAKVNAAHMARSVFKASIDNYKDVIGNLEHGLILFNRLAIVEMFKYCDLTDITSEDVDIEILFEHAHQMDELSVQLFHIKRDRSDV